mgnify:CR=1 FL=1
MGNQLVAKVMARAPISRLDKCRKYNHMIGYISNSNFQIFIFKTNFCGCRFLLQNVFLNSHHEQHEDVTLHVEPFLMQHVEVCKSGQLIV